MVEVQHVQSKGIYHGLLVFPDHVQGLTAIVTGANGMSGDHMVSTPSHESADMQRPNAPNLVFNFSSVSSASLQSGGQKYTPCPADP